MEHRWGHRREIDKGVRLKLCDGRTGFGRLRNLSVTGAWITTELPGRPLSVVEVGFTRADGNRRVLAHESGMIVRIAWHGLAVEWFEFAPAGVLALLALPPPRLVTGRAVVPGRVGK